MKPKRGAGKSDVLEKLLGVGLAVEWESGKEAGKSAGGKEDGKSLEHPKNDFSGRQQSLLRILFRDLTCLKDYSK